MSFTLKDLLERIPDLTPGFVMRIHYVEKRKHILELSMDPTSSTIYTQMVYENGNKLHLKIHSVEKFIQNYGNLTNIVVICNRELPIDLVEKISVSLADVETPEKQENIEKYRELVDRSVTATYNLESFKYTSKMFNSFSRIKYPYRNVDGTPSPFDKAYRAYLGPNLDALTNDRAERDQFSRVGELFRQYCALYHFLVYKGFSMSNLFSMLYYDFVLNFKTPREALVPSALEAKFVQMFSDGRFDSVFEKFPGMMTDDKQAINVSVFEKYIERERAFAIGLIEETLGAPLAQGAKMKVIDGLIHDGILDAEKTIMDVNAIVSSGIGKIIAGYRIKHLEALDGSAWSEGDIPQIKLKHLFWNTTHKKSIMNLDEGVTVDFQYYNKKSKSIYRLKAIVNPDNDGELRGYDDSDQDHDEPHGVRSVIVTKDNGDTEDQHIKTIEGLVSKFGELNDVVCGPKDTIPFDSQEMVSVPLDVLKKFVHKHADKVDDITKYEAVVRKYMAAKKTKDDYEDVEMLYLNYMSVFHHDKGHKWFLKIYNAFSDQLQQNANVKYKQQWEIIDNFLKIYYFSKWMKYKLQKLYDYMNPKFGYHFKSIDDILPPDQLLEKLNVLLESDPQYPGLIQTFPGLMNSRNFEGYMKKDGHDLHAQLEKYSAKKINMDDFDQTTLTLEDAMYRAESNIEKLPYSVVGKREGEKLSLKDRIQDYRIQYLLAPKKKSTKAT